jgi:hypothetical protein
MNRVQIRRNLKEKAKIAKNLSALNGILIKEVI